MTDIVQVLRNYQAWMKDGIDGEPSIHLDDINGDETFGEAADEIERLRESLQPFALFASAAEEMVEDTDKYLTPIAKHKHQAIVLGAFKNAREVMPANEVPDQEDFCAGCGYIKCRCKEPHAFTPNKDGYCTWCGMDDLNPVEAHMSPERSCKTCIHADPNSAWACLPKSDAAKNIPCGPDTNYAAWEPNDMSPTRDNEQEQK